MKKRSLIYVILCLAMLSGCIQHTEVDNVLLNVSRLPSSGSRISFEKIDLEIDKITAMDEGSKLQRTKLLQLPSMRGSTNMALSITNRHYR